MKKNIKIIIKIMTNQFLSFLYRRPNFLFIIDMFIDRIRNNVKVINYKNVNYTFYVPNSLSYYRVNTFSSKEPETLVWINQFSFNSTFWDIGANIGLYSIYAAKSRNANAYAFEPSVFNLEILARNINLNHLENNIIIIPIPLTDKTQFNMMRMTSTEWSGALSSFQENIGWDGKSIDTVFNYQILGVSMNSMVKSLGLSLPDYIKIDVDGIEHFILMGGEDILMNVKEVLIEVNDCFHDQVHQCTEILTRNGLKMVAKKHSAEFEEVGAFGDGKVWNQIWKRI